MAERDDKALRRAARAHGETEEQVLDRNFLEILQELRVAQTGVQILFAFLLGIGLSGPMQQAGPVDRWTYVVTLLASAGATALLIAPVAFHRLLFRRRARRELVQLANRCAIGGLALLGIAVTGAVLLVLRFVLGGWTANALTAAVAAWLLLFWLGLPLRQRLAAGRS